MRTLHVITGLSTGGAERVLFNILSGGLAESKDVAVLSLRDEGTYGPKIQSLGIPVYTLGMRRGLPGPLSAGRLRRIVRDFRPEVIQGWMYHGNLAATVAAWMMPGARPALAWNIRHSLYSLGAEKRLTRLVIGANLRASRNVDALVYNSRLSLQQHEAFGFASKYGQVIPNGFDTESLHPDSECGRAMRDALDIPSQAVVIGHVARFHPMKDHASFLHAAVEVMHQRPEVVCLLAGRSVNLSNPALAGIVPLELQDRFRFLGERGDVPDLMRAMDILCMSSAWGEAFPNVLGEAMALSVPCVTTDVGDSRDIVDENGEIVPPSDSSALAKGLIAMLDRSTEAQASLGRAARERVVENYSLPSVVEQYRRLYERLITT